GLCPPPVCRAGPRGPRGRHCGRPCRPRPERRGTPPNHRREAMAETLVWIGGATGGLGLGLARHVPYADARIVNISRRQHPAYETLITDIADPAGWQRVREHFARELAGFAGSRAIFIHNAYS